MIVKKMKRTNFSKSKAAMISDLVDYIFATHDDQGKEKLARVLTEEEMACVMDQGKVKIRFRWFS